MEKPQPEKHLSAEQRLELRDEVQKLFTHLPGDTLKIIQGEVANRVAVTEKYYVRLAFLIGLLIVVVFGISWNNLRERTKDIAKRTGDVEALHSNILVRYNEITNLYALAFQRYSALTNRIHELESVDNLITAEQLQGEVKQVAVLKSESEEALFTATVAAAESGDATAYDKLRFWAADSTNSLAQQSQDELVKMQTSMSGPFYASPGVTTHVTTTWDLALGFENAKGVYMRSLPEARVSVIETIANSTNFTKADRMNFLVEVAQRDSTLVGRRRAVELINDESKSHFLPFRGDLVADWWRTNKASYILPK